MSRSTDEIVLRVEGDFPPMHRDTWTVHWYDAHPASKVRENWMTRADAVDRLFARSGLMPRSRVTPAQGDN